MARLSPIARQDWSPDMAAFMSEYGAIVKGERNNAGRPSAANLLGTFAHHPDLTRAFLTFNGHILNGATITERTRELLILRVAHLRRSDYEWAQHTLLAGDAGLSSQEISRVTEGPAAGGWSALDRSLLRATDELVLDGVIGEVTWGELAAEFDNRQLLDIMFTVCAYELLAKVLRSVDVEPEPDLVQYLPVRR